MAADPPAVSVVLPTFNEADSLPVIVPRIVQTLREAGIEGEVIVVDDNSPDGTAAVGERLANDYPVRVIKRTEERGLATAVTTGFDASRAEVVIVMDADGSHPVSALPEMVRLIAGDKTDIVVGSRNVSGGGSRNWPLFSQLKSKFAASLTIALTSMTDPTTGFMALRRSLLDGLELDPVGWKIVLEVVVKAAPARVMEVPIVFEDRELGESKQSLGVFLEYVSHLSRLYGYRYPALVEFLKFCLVGLFGLFVDLGTVIAAKELFALDTRICAVIGFTVAVTSNYTLNRLWTFRRARELPLLWSYATYVGANLLGLSIRMLAIQLLIVLASIDQGYGYVMSNAIGIVLATALNFVGAKYFAFDPDRLAFESAAEPVDAPIAPGLADSHARPDPKARLLATLVIAAACLYTAVDATALRELTTGDEGVNVTMAKNMAQDAAFVVRPSVYPGGHTDWRSQDLPALGNLPLFPALLAAADQLGGLAAMGLLPLLSLWSIVFFSARLLRPLGGRAALYTALLLSTSPAFLVQARMLEFEPLLTAFCAAGLFVFARGTSARSPARCVAGGALLGLGFLTKMWLIVPYAGAVCAFILVQATLVRARESEPLALRRSVIAFGLGFGVVASLHLVWLAIVAPADVPVWVRSVYLAIVSGEGVTGDKLTGAGVHAARPVWFYPATLYHDHFHLLPLILFGLPALLRRTRPGAVSVLAMTVGGLLGLVALSVPAAKEPLYALSVVPLLYMLAGVSLAELEQDAPLHRPANRATVKAAITLAVLSLIALGLVALLGRGPGWSYLALHAAGVFAVAILGTSFLRSGRLAVALAVLCALVLVDTVGHEQSRPALPHAGLAELLAPGVVTGRRAEPSFVAPESALLTGYLGQRGRDWSPALRSELISGSPLQYRAYVLGPRQLARPESDPLLGRLGRELDELEHGLGPGYRVFVRR